MKPCACGGQRNRHARVCRACWRAAVTARPELRACVDCGETKPLAAFRARPTHGVRTVCRPCAYQRRKRACARRLLAAAESRMAKVGKHAPAPGGEGLA